MLVIGLGRFGTSLACRLSDLGNEVMAIDRDEENVSKIADCVTAAQIGDCMDIDVLKSLGVDNYDVCFVCISEDFQSSLEITSNLKELGAKHIVSKAERDIHAKFLLKVGADEIVYPERDMAGRAAAKYSAKGAFEYVELTPEYAIFETEMPENWIGRSLRDMDIRSKYNINVIGLKKDGRVTPVTNPDHLFESTEHLVIAGGKEDLMKFLNK